MAIETRWDTEELDAPGAGRLARSLPVAGQELPIAWAVGMLEELAASKPRQYASLLAKAVAKTLPDPKARD